MGIEDELQEWENEVSDQLDEITRRYKANGETRSFSDLIREYNAKYPERYTTGVVCKISMYVIFAYLSLFTAAYLCDIIHEDNLYYAMFVSSIGLFLSPMTVNALGMMIVLALAQRKYRRYKQSTKIP
jgi:hypothetical protein